MLCQALLRGGMATGDRIQAWLFVVFDLNNEQVLVLFFYCFLYDCFQVNLMIIL